MKKIFYPLRAQFGHNQEKRATDFMGTKLQVIERIGAPGVTRTRGTRIRNPLLYPPELQGQQV